LSKISIIIPTINEANNLPLLLSDLSTIHKDGEIIIVDCGSEDKTIDIANIYGAKVLISKERNRGLQLGIGARNSKGDWLIFLHADTRLTHDWFRKTNSFLKGNRSSIYYFKFQIKNKNIIYRFLELFVNTRTILFKTPYGDQGLVINRKTYFKNDGYREIPIMEDLDFIMRLRNKSNLKLLNVPIYTSSRKWNKSNIILQALKNWKLRRRWLKGYSLNSIYEDYYKN